MSNRVKRVMVKKWIVRVSILISSIIPLLSTQAQISIGPERVHRGTTIEVIQPGNFSLQSVVDGITDASANKPYLIQLGPGVYTNIGPDAFTGLTMKPYVSIVGSGQNVTILRGAISSGSIVSASSAVILGADNMMISHISIENTGGSTNSIGVLNNSASPNIKYITATASGGTAGNYGVRNLSSSSPMMYNVTASASGGTNSYGVSNQFLSSPMMQHVAASASDGTNNFAIDNNSSSNPRMHNVTASVSGGTTSNYGVSNNVSSPTMYNVTASASGGGTSYGVFNSSANSAPQIHASFFAGGTAGIDLGNSIGTRITNTLIAAGIVNDPGGTQCRDTFDQTLANVNC